MLTEEAFILLATLAASGFLILGVVELVWPAAPRRQVRRSSQTPSMRFDAGQSVASPASPVVDARRSSSALRPPAAPPSVRSPRTTPSPPTVDDRPTGQVAPAGDAALVDDAVATGVASDVPPLLASLGDDVRPPEAAAPSEAGVPAAPVEARQPRATRLQVLPIDTCLSMYKERRFAEVVSLGSAALQVHARLAQVSDRPHEAAALHDLVGLAKQELGDREGAREAFIAAVREADAFVRPTYVRHLVTLVRSALDPSLAAVSPADGEAAASRVRELRLGLTALEEALAVASGDEGLESTRTALREALAPACERLVVHLVSAEGDEEARTLILETLADEAMPTAWRDRLREQLAVTSSAEIGQLTAQAIRSLQDGKDMEALHALERAERLSTSLPSGAVVDERREEFERRLWWGYTRVGLRRVETRKFEDALDPLFHALRIGGLDEERVGETRSALVRALNGLVDAKWPEFHELGAHDARAAQVELEKLSALLRSSMEQGLSEDDVADALAKVAELRQTLPKPNS